MGHMSMNVSLGETLEEFIREKVTQGEYGSNSEVVREGLRLLKRREEQWKAEIAAKIEEGMAQLKAGKGIPAEKAWAELHSRREAALKKLDKTKNTK
jgi:antitoxin ParD1/3/4